MNTIHQHAQQVLRFGEGLPPIQGPASDPAIARSWRRCLEQYHLDPSRLHAPCVMERPRLNERRERLERIIAIARWQMNSLHQQLGGSDHAILLTDTQGVVIDSLARDAERADFQRAGLWLGAVWDEATEGTNGVGTCLVERQPLTIRRDAHFHGRHTGLTCSASLILDPCGEPLAVLNVSTCRDEPTGRNNYQTMALTSLSAKLIEDAYFVQTCNGRRLLRLHARPEYLGMLSEGLLAFDERGRIEALNEAALSLLGETREALLGRRLEHLFELSVERLLDPLPGETAGCLALRTRDGRLLHGQLARPAPATKPSRGNSQAPSGAAGPCLADPRLHEAFGRACRVLERDVPVLLHGETGTGKDAFAAALHRAGSRASKPFVAINCAAIPESLIESELFGYRSGSFTGAHKDGMTGKLLQADGGILFLDEIGDMPLAMQTRLLRVLESRQVQPLGAAQALPLDVRLVSASHRDLPAMIAEGTFREDLYYRLAGLQITLPPLRERSDKAELIEQLLSEEAAGEPLRLAPEARQALLVQPWPGNVRQLRTLLRALVALAEDGRIELEDVRAVQPELSVAPLPTTTPLADAEREALLATLDAEHWHMTRAARALGVSRNTLYRKLRRHGIDRS